MTQQAEITQRDLNFELGAADLVNWHAAGAQVSLFFDALSTFFPDGERFFIRSVRHYADRIEEPQLRTDVQGFIGQEAMHGREHRAYNRALDRAGLPAAAVERHVERDLKRAEKIFSPPSCLAMTIALEHLTAIMASLLLREPRSLAGCDPAVAALWRWHAVEESEHKAVAFDVYQTVAPRGYLRRCLQMLQVTLFFFAQLLVVHGLFCWRAGVFWDLRGWGRCWWYLWGRPGMLRRIIRPWLAYFRPGFHPWEDDNRRDIDAWKAAQAVR